MNVPKPVCLGVHAKVDREAKHWRTGTPALKQAAARLEMIVETVEQGAGSAHETVELVLRMWNLKRIQGSEIPILEVGGNAKGGAPRLFVVTFAYGWVFLAAGVEKKQHGLKAEIENAKARASELASRQSEVWTEASIRAWLAGRYRVVCPAGLDLAIRSHRSGASASRR